jgi:hypothetical protein
VRAGLVLSLVALGIAAAASSSFAHHSTAAYDNTRIVTLTGTVTSLDWRNPHVRIHLDVSDGSGRIIHWDAETWGTGQMSLRGLTNGFIKPGDHVSTDVFVAKDGTPKAFVRTLTLPDGNLVDGPPADSAGAK